jgi:hypothetical protein
MNMLEKNNDYFSGTSVTRKKRFITLDAAGVTLIFLLVDREAVNKLECSFVSTFFVIVAYLRVRLKLTQVEYLNLFLALQIE